MFDDLELSLSAAGPSDRRLVDRVMAGDETALGHIYDNYAGLVYGLARRVTGSESLAEEITQEVFAFLWNQPERFDAARGSLRSFLGAITHRRAVDAVRRESRRTARENRVAIDPSGHDDDQPDPSVGAAANDIADRVRAAVRQLPADQRVAIELAYFGGCSFRYVAVRLGIPEGTAKSRLRLALAKLRSQLEREVAVA